jgi:hypothetical protein
MPRHPVDLSSHLNQTVTRGHPADFPVALVPVGTSVNDAFVPVPHRLAVVREDTGEALAVVSDRYTLVPHQRLLDVVQAAIAALDVGPVPRGVYVDRGGARMRALYKFPALAQPLASGDEICPCLQVRNTYDGTARIALHIGAFRFVCTNLAVGGGGVFAGGFLAVHAGEIPIDEAAEQLRAYLAGFDAIVALYRTWMGQPFDVNAVTDLFHDTLSHTAKAIATRITALQAPSVYDAYNAATSVATHEMRSARTAFDLLAHINRRFQAQFPA